MPPNMVDVTHVNLYKGIDNRYVTVIVVAVVWAVFLLLLIWARWRDKKDKTKVGAKSSQRLVTYFKQYGHRSGLYNIISSI